MFGGIAFLTHGNMTVGVRGDELIARIRRWLAGHALRARCGRVVYFERGAQLPDPHGLLGGHGRLRQTRTLTFVPGVATTTATHLVEDLEIALDYAASRR
jgi:hypothetical protein